MLSETADPACRSSSSSSRRMAALWICRPSQPRQSGHSFHRSRFLRRLARIFHRQFRKSVFAHLHISTVSDRTVKVGVHLKISLLHFAPRTNHTSLPGSRLLHLKNFLDLWIPDCKSCMFWTLRKEEEIKNNMPRCFGNISCKIC